jgi:hypothetical protein
MENSFNIDYSLDFRKSNGNLHIHPKGLFSAEMAEDLDRLITDEYEGEGRVFVRTADINLPDSPDWNFSIRIPAKVKPSDVYFKGETGFDIAPDGTRVIIAQRDMGGECRCNGNCRVCKCEMMGRKTKCCNKKHIH